LSTAVGEGINWAWACLRPGAAVVLDTETTDLAGVIVELAIVDSCTGKTLFDTLVNPGDVEVSDGARAVDGITDGELADAPRPADRPEPGLADRLLRVRNHAGGIWRICAVIDYAAKYCLALTIGPTR
jgi:hypothetical protein